MMAFIELRFEVLIRNLRSLTIALTHSPRLSRLVTRIKGEFFIAPFKDEWGV